MPKITINGKELEFENGMTVLQACELADVEIPRFCYHEKLSIAGNCRMCLVEMEKSPKPIASCAMPAAEGMNIKTNTKLVVKARKGGANYIYSVLVGYEEPPTGVKLDQGVYYNKYMIGNKIKMPNNLEDGLVEYADGTESTVEQMAKDVTTFLAWAAEPELEERHKTGVKVIIYLVLLTILVYLSMKKIWSRIDSEK